MPNRQAVVTLHPLFQPDDLPFRSLTFNTDSDSFSIGRASKRESKNLAPAHHNAWFDSRVMSRDHARLGVSSERRNIYIRDGGSMHGTFVNDKRIPVGQDITVNDGDVLTFGTEVTRGTETFAPLRVRCECQWFDSADGAPKPSHVTNTFCVPDDDDDDVVEVYQSTPTKPWSVQTYEIDDDSDTSDAENHPPMENSTPVTSPLNKDMPSTSKKDGGLEGRNDSNNISANGLSDQLSENVLPGTQRSPIVLDGEQRLVTPRMTPPPFADISASSTAKANSHFDLHDNASDHESLPDLSQEADSESQSDWDGDEEGADLEDDPMDPLPDDLYYEEDKDSVASDDSSPPEVSEASYDETNSEMEEASYRYDLSDEEFQSAKKPKPNTVEENTTSPSANNIESSSNTQQAQKRPENAPVQIPSLQPDWDAISKSVASTSPELPLFPSLRSFDFSVPTPTMDRWKSHNPSSSAFNMGMSTSYGLTQDHFSTLPPYTDGPFVNSQAPQSSGIQHHKFRLATFDGPYGDGRGGSASQDSPVEQPYGRGLTEKAASDGPQAERQSKTRVSIADIVDASTETPAIQKAPAKRKAIEMELDSFASDSAAVDAVASSSDAALSTISQPEKAIDDSFSQDAQPQETVNDPKDSYTQLTNLSHVDEPEPVKDTAPENERPSKRAKTSHPSSRRFASHAATAVLGAVVGGLGTIVALASLPPDYFN